jgi:tetratricopeptide (TPR) repeat protein
MRLPSLRCVYLILATALLACQTTPTEDPASKQAQILESAKTVVRTNLDAGKPELALSAMRELVREHPDDASIQNLMGLTQLALKNGSRAVKHFALAYKLDHQVATGLNLTSAYIEAGDHDRAIRLLTALMKQADRDKYQYKERIYHNLGYAYFRQNRMAKAEQWYQQALDENPTFFPSHLELGRLYQRTNRPAMAVKAYRHAIDYCTVCYEPVESLATLYSRLGKRADASRIIMTFSKNEAISPTDKARAVRLLNQITTAGLNLPNKG